MGEEVEDADIRVKGVVHPIDSGEWERAQLGEASCCRIFSDGCTDVVQEIEVVSLAGEGMSSRSAVAVERHCTADTFDERGDTFLGAPSKQT